LRQHFGGSREEAVQTNNEKQSEKRKTKNVKKKKVKKKQAVKGNCQ
jgi:hypothetical protein